VSKKHGLVIRDEDGVTADERMFLTEYVKDRNGQRAAIAVGFAPKGARYTAYRILQRPAVKALFNKMLEEYANTAGVERVKVLEKLRDAFFADTSKMFDAQGGILPPEQWPEECKKLISGYNSGTVTAAERITFHDQIKLGFDLLNEIKPLGQRKGDVPPANVYILNFDDIVSKLRKRGEVIDVTPQK